MNNRILAVVVLSVMFAAGAAMAAPIPPFATAVTLSDLNATATFDFSGGGSGMTGWTVDGVSQLRQQWFWYRIGNTGPELPINSLTLDNVKVSDGNEAPGDDRVVAYYSGGGLKVSLDHVLTGGDPGTGVSDVAETIKIRNITAAAIDFHFFQFVDLNLMGALQDTLVQINLTGNAARQTKGGYAVAETVITPAPSLYQADYAATIRTLLANGEPDNLNNQASAADGDLGWAFQWNVSLAPGQEFLISKDKRFESVPEPSTPALLTVGALGLLAWAWRRRKLHKLGPIIAAAVVAAFAVIAQATPITIDTVAVGDPGNAGEGSGENYGGYGPDRICGAVDYNYSIGKYEVTAGQYKDFLNAVGGVDAYALYSTGMSRADYGCGIARSGDGTVGDPYTYTVDANFANRPVTYVSWGDAARFANWLHNGQPTGAQDLSTTEDGAYYLNGATTNAGLLAISREADWKWAITSEDEWYKAAYYKGGSTNAGYWDYPTRADMPATPGNDMADASGNNANYDTGSGACPIDSGKYTTLAGEFQNSDSPYGTFDQGGNVWEWNEAIPSHSSSRGLRGGGWYFYSISLAASCRDGGVYPAYENSFVGFRVANVPEPGGAAMLLGIALTALLYWWRKRA